MNYIFDHKSTARAQRLLLAALALGFAFGTVSHAQQQTLLQKVTPPATPTLITPPIGNSAFLVGHAKGTQGYICLPTSVGASTAVWTGKPARPEATLFQSFFGQDFQIITHFLSPDLNPTDPSKPVPFANATWMSSFDSSRVWAAVPANNSIDPSASEPSCPNTGSIACLLLQTVGSLEGPTGGSLLSQTTFIQRLNTKGGSAPADGCFVSADVGKQVLVPYTADYFFYRADKN